MHVTQLFYYPLKGCQGIKTTQASLTTLGINGDRRLVVVDEQGGFVNGKRYPKMNLIRATLDGKRIQLAAPNMPDLELTIPQEAPRTHVEIWGSKLEGKAMSETANAWLSRYLEGNFRLCFYDEHSQRQVKRRPEYPVSFADSSPILVVSQQSLDALNRFSGRDDEIEQFRPNLVIDADQPFAEESWQQIRIGDVVLESVKSCSRCSVVTADLETGKPDAAGEPLKSLGQLHRRHPDQKIIFGQYFVVTQTGNLQVGLPVEVLATQPVAEYEPLPDKNVQSSFSVTFEPMTVTTQGQADETLLEIAENAGVVLPSSCRQGSCGCCRVRLVSGEVEQAADYALSQDELDDGFILACSCYPRSEVVIEID